jgi:hypothetical protein
MIMVHANHANNGNRSTGSDADPSWTATEDGPRVRVWRVTADRLTVKLFSWLSMSVLYDIKIPPTVNDHCHIGCQLLYDGNS